MTDSIPATAATVGADDAFPMKSEPDVFRTLRFGKRSRSLATKTGPETSTIAMSSIIFVSVKMLARTLKSLRFKGKRPTPLRTMESSTRQMEGNR